MGILDFISNIARSFLELFENPNNNNTYNQQRENTTNFRYNDRPAVPESVHSSTPSSTQPNYSGNRYSSWEAESSVAPKSEYRSNLYAVQNSEQRYSADNRYTPSSNVPRSSGLSYASVASRNTSQQNLSQGLPRTKSRANTVSRKLSIETLMRKEYRNQVKSLNFQDDTSKGVTLLWNNLGSKIGLQTKIVEIEMYYYSKIHKADKNSQTQISSFIVSGNYVTLQISGFIYHFAVHFYKGYDSNNERDLLGSAYGRYSSILNQDELDNLMGLAVPVFKRKTQVKVLYRNKPAEYFNDIHRNKHGIMKPYIKDFHGDPGCPINGKIDGLFFAANSHGGCLPDTSPFGNTRVVIPVTKLVNENMNLYFADFYCNSGPHYVTLVVTKPGSRADDFCADHLIVLDLCNNSFMWKEGGKIFIPNGVLTEVLYTENIDISGYEQKRVQTRGKGTSTKKGIAKDPDCSTCNLYPDERENNSADFY